MPLAFSPENLRNSERTSVECQAQIWGATLPPSSALLINISSSGCMIRCDQLVSIGESLTIDVPGICTLRGRAIWSANARVGVELETALAEGEFQETLIKLIAQSAPHAY